ncbi:hypothetical protein KAR91_40885 [Candidatus Pacearchaeota archaeon]|nr:hypothetical protein [Candidatus Pacearchaeota archaeon]
MLTLKKNDSSRETKTVNPYLLMNCYANSKWFNSNEFNNTENRIAYFVESECRLAMTQNDLDILVGIYNKEYF